MDEAHHGDKTLAILIIGASVVCFIAALVTAIVLSGNVNAKSTPAISAFLGILAILVPAIAAIIRGTQTRQLVREVDKKVNGHLSRLTDAAIAAGVTPEDLPALPSDLQKPAGQ